MSDIDQAAAADRYPDVFADAVNVAVNPYALALTFLLSDPVLQGDPAAARVVTRVRLAPELARVLGEALTQAGHSPTTAKA